MKRQTAQLRDGTRMGDRDNLPAKNGAAVTTDVPPDARGATGRLDDVVNGHGENVGYSRIECQAVFVGSSRTSVCASWHCARMATLADRLRRLRRDRGWTQVEAAAEAGISRAHIGKLETGGDTPGLDSLVKLARAYGVTLDYLRSGAANDQSGLGQFVNDPLEIAWLNLWRAMSADTRGAVLASLQSTVLPRPPIGP